MGSGVDTGMLDHDKLYLRCSTRLTGLLQRYGVLKSEETRVSKFHVLVVELDAVDRGE